MRRTETIVLISAVVVAILIGLTSLMPPEIYSSVVWHIMWGGIAVALLCGIIMGRLWRNLPVFIIHISLFFMIAGGFCTSFLSRRGTLHLFPSETADRFVTANGKMEKLPTAVTLLSFSPEYYPGMNFPKDFKSELKTASGDTVSISMNHIGRIGNYRLYQTSYDQQGGTLLTVTHDPIGIAVTYTGFLLFAIGGVAWLVKLARRSGQRRKALQACVLLCFMVAGTGNASAVPAVDLQTADSLATKQVLFNGRAVSFAGFADRLTHKLTGRGSVGSLSPEAFVASLIKYRDEWTAVPFLKVKSGPLRKALSIEGKYAAVADLYDKDGEYIPARLYEGGAGPLDKDILALDEKVALLIELWNGELFKPLPFGSEELRSEFSIRTEVIYHKAAPVRVLFILSLLAVVIIVIKGILRKNISVFPFIAAIGILGIAAYGWLWSISGSIPLSATPDIMEFVGICMILLSGIMAWRKEPPLLVALGMAAAAFLLLVAMLGINDPVMSPVMPVLASPWLSVHVSLVMTAYAILGFTFPVALCALALKRQRERLISLALSLLAPGVFLLGLGIITGAMWANVSWGRYWAWDPKETWSLVTLLLYSIPLHRYFGMRRLTTFCSLYLLFAFLSVIMTYFGVNLLPSLHAYN